MGRRQQDKALKPALTVSSFSLFNMEVHFYLKSSFLFWLVMQKFCFWSGFCHRSLILLHCLIYTYFSHFFAIWFSYLTDPLLVISPCLFFLHSFNDDPSTLSTPPPSYPYSWAANRHRFESFSSPCTLSFSSLSPPSLPGWCPLCYPVCGSVIQVACQSAVSQEQVESILTENDALRTNLAALEQVQLILLPCHYPAEPPQYSFCCRHHSPAINHDALLIWQVMLMRIKSGRYRDFFFSHSDKWCSDMNCYYLQ